MITNYVLCFIDYLLYINVGFSSFFLSNMKPFSKKFYAKKQLLKYVFISKINKFFNNLHKNVLQNLNNAFIILKTFAVL